MSEQEQNEVEKEQAEEVADTNIGAPLQEEDVESSPREQGGDIAPEKQQETEDGSLEVASESDTTAQEHNVESADTVKVEETAAEVVATVEIEKTAAEVVATVEIEKTAAESLATVEIEKTAAESLATVEIEKTAAESLATVEIEKTAAESLATVEIEKTAAESADTVKVEKTAAEPADTVEVEKTAAEPADTVKVEKTAAEPADTVEVEKTAAEPADTVEVEKTAAEPADTVKVEKTAAEPVDVVKERSGDEQKKKEDASKKDGPEEAKQKQQQISYDYNDLKSKPEIVNITQDTYLELHHSLGYECQKRSNLMVLDKITVAFSAGNMVQLLNISTMEQHCLRSLGGCGIGALAVHPSKHYFAVGEKGIQPVIAIFTYPELQLHRMLRGGTEEMYSHMDFSSGEGSLLASVGGHPDFMLTVWDWENESTVLRCKAFSQEVYRVSFSPDNPGQLTTSGTGHIRFWKMATTFTGLKLQGQLGKFGRTELSDIAAYVELPDGKVLSGTEWGNMLLWDGGFIKVEISRKNNKFCHHGMIETLFLDDGELISAGVDGYIRLWDFETIDNADITDDENTSFEMDPLAEIRVGHDVSLKSLSRSADPDTPTLWYAQDAAGAIWKVDITSSHTRQPPEKLISYHSGPVCGLSCSPAGHQAASIGHDGSVRVYDLDSRDLLCHTHFSGGGASLIWAPPTVESTFTTLLAGFRDGVMRVLCVEQSKKRQGGHQLTLQHACKPHSQPITCLAVDTQGQILATGSADCTVFFLHISDKYKPVGFIHTPAPVTSIHWTHLREDGVSVVVCCNDGSILEARSPLDGDYDTSKTYHLHPLPCYTRTFTSIKDRLRAEEEEARLSAEREKKRREKEAAKERRKEQMGDDYVSEEEEEEEQGDEDKEGEGGDGEGEGGEEEEDEKPKGPSPILSTLVTSNDDKFWVSMGGYDAGYLYQCSMEGASSEPGPYEAPFSIPVPTYDGRDLPLHSMCMSSSGHYMFTGSSNGIIRVHNIPPSLSTSPSSLDSYWSLAVHDNHIGAITHLSITCDDHYVITAGADGNVFVFSTHLPSVASTNTATSTTLEALPPSKPARDIDDPSHYSIEDAKQKTEHDRRVKQAEMRKQSVRKEIGRLRRTFLQLVQRNAQLTQPLQLPANEFIMDPSLEENMKKQAQQQVELVKKEMAWEAEKHAIALDKLHKWFKAVVECERVVVWSFSGNKSVSSYRVPRPSTHFMTQLEKELSNQQLQTPGTVAYSERRDVGFSASEQEVMMEEDMTLGDEERGRGTEEEGVVVSKQEARRLRREKRKKEWEELMARRPEKGEEDPEEAALVEQFKENMGDYKLKTASDYVVPKHQRATFSKKKRSLIFLRNQIFEYKREYNRKLMALRNQKQTIIEKATSLLKELEIVQSVLHPSLHITAPVFPALRPEEVPEKTKEYSKESLLQFAAEKGERERAEREAAAGVGEGFGGFGGFGGGGEQGESGEEVKTEGAEQTEESLETADNEEEVSSEQEDKEETDEVGDDEQEEKITVELSELGLMTQQEKEVQLLFQQTSLIEQLEEMRHTFDETLFRLAHEKTQLDCTMITASLKHITQYQELTLLREFEKKEKTFTSRYQSKKKESRDMDTKIHSLNGQLRQHEKKLAQLQEQEKALNSQFMERVGESNKFKDFLMKVFRKKIKRVKAKGDGGRMKGGEGENVEEDSEDEEDDSDFFSSSEEESEVGEEGGTLDDSVCPAGCDPTLFSLACTLRESRLDLEEALAEEKKATDQTRKELEASKKKLKTMESHVKTAQGELEAFQLKKQQRLNELDRVVVLRLHQILHHNEGAPPSSTSPCLVFPDTTLNDLSLRIATVKEEKRMEKQRYKELHHHHVRLVREKRELEGKVREWQEKVHEAMRLKFGRVVDLDKLGAVTANRTVEDLHSKLKTQETQQAKQLALLKGQIERAKQQLLGVVRENTQQLVKLNDLMTSQDSLEMRLNARQKSLRGDVSGARGDEEEEMERLHHLTSLQAQEMIALQHEIRVLSTKGGKILPPLQPPVGPPPPGISPVM